VSQILEFAVLIVVAGSLQSLQQLLYAIGSRFFQNVLIVLLQLPAEILQEFGLSRGGQTVGADAPTSMALCDIRMVPLWHPYPPSVAILEPENG
jgi:hypothetical protein